MNLFISIFVDQPILVLLPTIFLFLFYMIVKRFFILIATVLWFLYFIYEMAISYGIICAGECNIRYDLVIISYLLIILFVASTLMWVASLKLV